MEHSDLKHAAPSTAHKSHLVNADTSGTKLAVTRSVSNNCGGGYDFHFVESLPDGSDLVCKICCFPSRNPHLSSCCGHTFCKSCIENLKETATLSKTCPVCRDSEFPVVQNKQIDRVIRSLHVYCTNEKEGCEWHGEINDTVTHLNHCQYEEVKCDNRGCKSIVQRRLLKSHMTECLYRSVNCRRCHVIGSFRFINQEHEDECPKSPLLCPNSCDVGTVTREDLSKHREICPLEMIGCEYCEMGCESKVARKDVEDHNQKNVEEHLRLVKRELAYTKKNLAQAQKDAEDVNKILIDLHKKFKEQTKAQGESIKRLEMQLYNSMCQLHRNCNPWTLKLNALAAMSMSGDQVVPVVLKMMNFAKLKREKEWWHSDFFYSHNEESRIHLSVYPGDNTDGKDAYLSVQLSLMYDESAFPSQAMIKLLNQVDDQKHHCITLDYHDTNNITVTKSQWMVFGEWRSPLYISHESLNTVSNTCNFIKNDCLFFEVHLRTHPTDSKSWQRHSILPNQEHVHITNSLSLPLTTKVSITEYVFVLYLKSCVRAWASK